MYSHVTSPVTNCVSWRCSIASVRGQNEEVFFVRRWLTSRQTPDLHLASSFEFLIKINNLSAREFFCMGPPWTELEMTEPQAVEDGESSFRFLSRHVFLLLNSCPTSKTPHCPQSKRKLITVELLMKLFSYFLFISFPDFISYSKTWIYILFSQIMPCLSVQPSFNFLFKSSSKIFWAFFLKNKMAVIVL